ncbi:MAG: hypothetical protein ACU841_10440 [Gammaproteobacteria bacterium]
MKFRTDSVNPHAVNSSNWSEQSLTDWLHQLSVENGIDSCRQLLAVLQALDSAELTVHQRTIFLGKIADKLDTLAHQIEKTYLDAGFPLNSDEQSRAELVTRLYAALSGRYLALVQTMFAPPDSLTDRAKATVLYQSFRALDKTLLTVSMIYNPPYQGFWLNCYSLYKMAEKASLLDIAITEQGRKGNTVNDRFKHILLFALANANQFRPREMKSVYKSLENHSSPAIIETDPSRLSHPQLCVFNLGRDEPPHPVVSPPHAVDADDRYISIRPVARNLYQSLQQATTSNNALKSIHHAIYTRAIKTLSLSQRRKFNRNKERFSSRCVVGFSQIAGCLDKSRNDGGQEHKQTPQKNSRITRDWKAPNYDLIPMDDDAAYQLEALIKQKNIENPNIVKILKLSRELSQQKKIWDPIEAKKNEMTGMIPNNSVEIIDSSAQGLQVLWKHGDVKVKIGELIAMINGQGNTFPVGLIRRMHIQTPDEIALGIEMIGYDSESVRMARPNRSGQMYPAIFLPGIAALKQSDSILFNTSEFSTGEFVTLYRGNETVSCRLNKLINSTAAISHMELYYSDNSLFND